GSNYARFDHTHVATCVWTDQVTLPSITGGLPMAVFYPLIKPMRKCRIFIAPQGLSPIEDISPFHYMIFSAKQAWASSLELDIPRSSLRGWPLLPRSLRN